MAAPEAREAWVVVDLGYGDQGKGSVVDFLVRDRGARTVIRYNGGPQAAHNVVTDDGRHHTFAQLGAGSFVPGVLTVLTEAMAIQPWAMQVEVEHLARAGVGDAFERALVHEGAIVVTPFHRATNRLRELARGGARHGSCGVGLGEAVSAARVGRPTIRARDLADRQALARALALVQADMRDAARALEAPDVEAAVIARAELADPRLPALVADLLGPFRARARVVGDEAVAAVLARPGAVVFEGAHGVLLDEDFGFHPYTTWSACTSRHAEALLARCGYGGRVTRLGVLRAYATRHGPGPFPTEAPLAIEEPHNRTDPWQGPFRVGWLDAVATRYARAANGGVDGLALTCLDRMPAGPEPWAIATSYAIDGHTVTDLALPRSLEEQAELTRRVASATASYVAVSPEPEALIEAVAGAVGEVALTSSGATAASKRWRRAPASA